MRRDRRHIRHPVRRWLFITVVRPLVHLIFWPRVRGRRRPAFEGAGLLIANHVSLLDPAFLMLSCDTDRLRFIAKQELFERPFMGFFVRSFDTIPLDRNISDVQAARRIFEALRDGNTVGIFIEGTRVKRADADRYPPKGSILRIAMKKKLPIRLASIRGPVFPFSAPLIRYGPTVVLSARRDAVIAKEDYDAFARELMRRIYALTDQPYANETAEADRACFEAKVSFDIVQEAPHAV